MSILLTPDPDIQPVDWKTIEDACYSWLNDLLDLDGRIIWERQKVTQPEYPYLSLFRDSEVDAGLDEERDRTVDVDGKIVGQEYGAGDPYENEAIVYQPIDWTLSITAHCDAAHGGNDPSANPMWMIGKAKRSLGQRATIDRLAEAGISVVRKLASTDTSVVVSGEWVYQATFDVLLRTASVITERQGFIEKVELKSTQFNIDTVIDVG